VVEPRARDELLERQHAAEDELVLELLVLVREPVVRLPLLGSVAARGLGG